MSYSRPPLYASASVALIVGNSNVTLIAAPGAARRLRIIGVGIGINRTATGSVDATVQSLAGATQIARNPGAFQLTGTSGLYIPLPMPGIQIEVNDALQVTFASSAATGSGLAFAYYYNDGSS